MNWDEALKLYNQETETLEGGGIIVHTDGTVGSAEYHHNDLTDGSDTTYVKDGVYYWADGDVCTGDFPNAGLFVKDMNVYLKVIGNSDYVTADFLRWQAEQAGYPDNDVFLGATLADVWDKDREAEGLDDHVDEYGEPLEIAYYMYGPA